MCFLSNKSPIVLVNNRLELLSSFQVTTIGWYLGILPSWFTSLQKKSAFVYYIIQNIFRNWQDKYVESMRKLLFYWQECIKYLCQRHLCGETERELTKRNILLAFKGYQRYQTVDYKSTQPFWTGNSLTNWVYCIQSVYAERTEIDQSVRWESTRGKQSLHQIRI